LATVIESPRASTSVVLDETAIAEDHAKIERRDEERASRPKPRRKKGQARASASTSALR
jgi:hypothetical protein